MTISAAAAGLRRKSGVRISIVVAGAAARIAATVGGEMGRAAVGQVVAVDRGDHHVLQPHLRHRLADARRFGGIERPGLAGGDVAEGAGPGADLAHDHHGRVRLLPALADVGAAGLLADGDQAVLAHDVRASAL